MFVGLITPRSVVSTYVLFELGARWGAGRLMIPLLARGATVADLRGPIGALSALSCDEPAQLHQFIDELANALSVTVDKPAVYEKCIRETVEESRKK